MQTATLKSPPWTGEGRDGMMRPTLLLAGLLLLPAVTGCIVPENMTVLKEELGYASVDLPDVVVRIQAEDTQPRVDVPIELTARIDGIAAVATNVTWRLGHGQEAYGPTIEHAWITPGPVTVNVTVTPPEGPPAYDAMTIRVHDNQAPLPAITVEDRGTLVDGDMAVLSAVESTDPDGDPLVHTWTLDGEAFEGPRIERQVTAGLHDVELTTSDGFTEVTVFDTFAVDLPIQREARLDLQGSTVEVPVQVETGVEALQVNLTHTTTAGMDDVRLALLDADGEVVAEAQSEPSPGTSEATEHLEVDGRELAAGTYTLKAELVRGSQAEVTIDGILDYEP